MNVGTTVTGFGQRLRSSGMGRAINGCAKYVAGCYFDIRGGMYLTDGLTFEVPREHTTRQMRGRFAVDTYERPERTLVSKYLPRRATVLELGGCIGVVSCTVNRMLDRPDKHVVVEANPRLIPVLERNRERNNARFSVEHCVISRSETARLAIADNMDSSRTSTEGTAVPTKTIEEIESGRQVRFDAIVMDIEGAESTVLRESEQVLKRVNWLLIEFHPSFTGESEVTALRQLLTGSGFVGIAREMHTELFIRQPNVG